MARAELAALSDGESTVMRDRYATMARLPVELIVCPLINDVNHGGILRAAEAFRAERVSFSPEEDDATDFAGNRGTLHWQPHRWLDCHESVTEAKANGTQIVALHLSDSSESIYDFDWHFPTCLVLGSEREGVLPEILAECDAHVAIPMFGLITSMNVAVATTLALEAITSAYRKLHPEFLPIREESKRLIK